MKSKKQIMLLLATATLFAACGGSDDEAVTPAPQPQQPRMLTVEVSERPLQTEGGEKAPRRADAATTTETLNTFRMCTNVSGYIWSEELTKTAGKWTTKWPSSSEEKYNFYAYNVGSAKEFVWNGGDPYVSFTMEEEVANQKDFLVAKTAEAKSYNETGGKISLTFDHACAAVQFFVYKEESVTYVVKEIKLLNVKKQGNYYFSKSWRNIDNSTNYTLTRGDITPTSTKELLPKGWLYVIPQSKEGMQLQITYTKDGVAKDPKVIDLSGSWAAGYQYTVNIKIGK